MIQTINSPQLYRPSQPVRDEAYKRFVRSFPCAVCGRQYAIEAAHTGPHGIRQKASDLSCIPLCRPTCHSQYDADPRGFAARHLLDVEALILKLNTLWFDEPNGGEAA